MMNNIKKCKICDEMMESNETKKVCAKCQGKIDYLKEHLDILIEHRNLINRYKRMFEENEDGIKAQVIKNMPNTHTVSDQISKNICDKEELRTLISQRENDLYESVMKVESAIGKIKESLYRDLLSAKYIDGKTWEEIAVNRKCNVRNIYRIHDEAIKVIDIPVEYKIAQ